MVGNNEWSGELITREEGTINDLDSWKIICEEVYLADIGVGSYTEYEVDKGGFKAADIVEMYDKFPQLLEGTHKNQHIHTHYTMSTFFSSTDWENLHDRALASNYVLMLIVNFKGDYCAKVAAKTKQSGKKATTLTLVNNSNGYAPLKLTNDGDKDVLMVMDCKIEYPHDVDDDFVARYESVKKAVAEEKAKKPVAKGTPIQGEVFSNNTYTSDMRWDEDAKEWRKKPKKIGDMTDKEFREFEEGKGRTKWQIRHAKAVLNSILDGRIHTEIDFSDPLSKIVAKNKSFLNARDLEEYMLEFDTELRERFDSLFPYNDDDEYAGFLVCLQDYILPYKYIRLANEILESVEWELEDLIPKTMV